MRHYNCKMKVCREINRENPAAIVITGDGRREFRVLSAVGRRYDGVKTLWFPKKPMKDVQIGLSPLEVLTLYPGKFKIYSFLYLVDREHFVDLSPKEKIKEYLKNKLKIEIIEVKEINSSALYFSCKVGLHHVKLYVSVFGREKCIEEEIASLIKLTLHLNVEPEKGKIEEILKANNIKEEKDLIEKSSTSIKDLENAFPGLASILEILEK